MQTQYPTNQDFLESQKADVQLHAQGLAQALLFMKQPMNKVASKPPRIQSAPCDACDRKLPCSAAAPPKLKKPTVTPTARKPDAIPRVKRQGRGQTLGGTGVTWCPWCTDLVSAFGIRLSIRPGGQPQLLHHDLSRGPDPHLEPITVA